MHVHCVAGTLSEMKIELHISGLEDQLEKEQFPLEGRFSAEVITKISQPSSKESFTLGLETV